jgi:hypothetical protein
MPLENRARPLFSHLAAPDKTRLFITLSSGRPCPAWESPRGWLVGLGRFELPTNGLGNRCSIHLSYSPINDLRN